MREKITHKQTANHALEKTVSKSAASTSSSLQIKIMTFVGPIKELLMVEILKKVQ
jgi:hypothetical protein